MKKINLIFPGLGYRDINQASIYVYDKNGNLLLNKKSYNGRIEICLDTKQIYIVKAISNYETVNASIYVNSFDNYNIAFPSSYVCNNSNDDNTITFLLTDFNYDNLPIEKGLIYLWQEQ